MWFKLASATFGTHLGSMASLSNSIPIRYNGLNSAFTISTSSVSKDDESKELKLTLISGWTCTSASATVTGASEASDSYSNGVLTINITPSSGTTFGDSGATEIVINVTHDATGGSTTDPTPGGTVITYTSRQSSSGISKSTGEYLSSSTGYVNIYENIDPTKTYAVTSYAPSNTSDNACVCYYTADGTFISAESGSDWGISSVEYTMQELTIPSTASIIKLFGRTNNQEAVLYLTSAISLREINYSSQKTSSNLNKTTGAYGSSSTGYVNIYDNIDTSNTYYGSGFCPNASGTSAAVCYYTSSGTFISAQDGNDFGVSSAGFVKQKLTVPSTTSTIKIFAQQKSAYPDEPDAALYVEQ